MLGITGNKRVTIFTPAIKHLSCIGLWILMGALCSIGFTGWVNITPGSCLLLSFGESALSGWPYKVFMFLVVNLILIVVTVSACLRSIYFIHKSGKQVKQMGHVFGKSKSGETYKNLALLAISSLVTWIPIEVLLVFSLCGMTIHSEVINWFAIFVLPINSITNPLLHTIRNVISQRGK